MDNTKTRCGKNHPRLPLLQTRLSRSRLRPRAAGQNSYGNKYALTTQPRTRYISIYIYILSFTRTLSHAFSGQDRTHTHTTMLEAFNERTRARVLASRWGLARRARGYARTGMCMLYIRTYVLPTCVTLYSYIRTTSTDGGRTRTRSPRAAPNLRLKDSTLNLQFGFKFPLVKSKGFIRDRRPRIRSGRLGIRRGFRESSTSVLRKSPALAPRLRDYKRRGMSPEL